MTDRTTLPYAIFGATGKVGKELLSFFSSAGIPVTAVTRDPAKIISLPFVNWEVADLEDTARVAAIVQHSRGIFLSSSYSDNMVALQSNVVNAAAEAGISPLVKLSAKGVVENPDSISSQAHAQVEQLIKTAGIDYTILQPASFIQAWTAMYMKTIQAEKKIYAAMENARIPFIDTRDIAEVAFRVLTEPAEHRNKSYVLTGGQAVDYYELADIFSWAMGEEISYVPLSPEEMHARMEQEGVQPMWINFFLNWAKSQREAGGQTSPWVYEILGKPPRLIADYITAYIRSLKQTI
ncbi:MAG TPA: NmrA family NAD(P)-binding protein [Chitinophaga sp.]